MTKIIYLLHSTKLVKENFEVGDTEEPAFTKGTYKEEEISYVANLDSGYLKKKRRKSRMWQANKKLK